MYPIEKSSKMPVVKDQRWASIFLTPENYSENDGSPARTEFLFQDGSLIAIWASLFCENFSLFPYFDFAVNFEYRITRTTRIAPNRRGIHACG